MPSLLKGTVARDVFLLHISFHLMLHWRMKFYLDIPITVDNDQQFLDQFWGRIGPLGRGEPTHSYFDPLHIINAVWVGSPITLKEQYLAISHMIFEQKEKIFKILICHLDTLTKRKSNFPHTVYKKIQSGAVAKSYMINGLLVYGEIFAHFIIY